MGRCPRSIALVVISVNCYTDKDTNELCAIQLLRNTVLGFGRGVARVNE